MYTFQASLPCRGSPRISILAPRMGRVPRGWVGAAPLWLGRSSPSLSPHFPEGDTVSWFLLLHRPSSLDFLSCSPCPPWSGCHFTSWPLFWVRGFQERRRLAPPEPWRGCVATCALALLLGVRGDGLWARGHLPTELSWPSGVFPRLRNAADVQHPAHHFLSSSSSEQIETTERPHLSPLRCSMIANTE